ncbi:PLP-dependent cysteine synthase family protein [Mucilaginibacter sp. dw_454]|uniref:PLP-dependent cysteine synthase family protein n=1 Tax=Mucilaginibacter sp. dw_454 TaxID=2720079 RepID=UPI001BD5B7FF|nr:PLP-dependent cysteine synthase family protein [Mucilaginibacter sp. dw_454]
MLSTPTKIKDKINTLWQRVGNTPMIEITYSYRGGPEQKILAKDERYNTLTGSIKDRMALYIIQKAYEQQLIRPGDMIVEATSGNTGIAFAFIGSVLGNPVKIFMPDWLSRERVELIKGNKAELQLVSREEGGFLTCIRLAELMQHNERVFLPRQFENEYNVEAHRETTGREIGHQLLLMQIKPDAFVAGVGTGGTIMGVSKFLKSLYPGMKAHPLEPAESPTLSTGVKAGNHRIQGISDEFIPAIVDLKDLDKIIQVNDGDAILMTEKLALELALPVGISSGANLLGAIKIQQDLGKDSVVITVLPDSNKKYLSTDLFDDEPEKDGYISPEVKLLQCRTLKTN